MSRVALPCKPQSSGTVSRTPNLSTQGQRLKGIWPAFYTLNGNKIAHVQIYLNLEQAGRKGLIADMATPPPT